jgi:hypothetical protein
MIAVAPFIGDIFPLNQLIAETAAKSYMFAITCIMIFRILIGDVNPVDWLATVSAQRGKEFDMADTVIILTVFYKICRLSNRFTASGTKEVFRMIVLAVYREV